MVYNNTKTIGRNRKRLYFEGNSYFMVEMGCWIKTFFWKFPEPFVVDMMKGNEAWIKKSLPSYRRNAKQMMDPNSKAQLGVKINELRKYGYVALGIMKLVLDAFTVPKVDNIRPAFNDVSSGLNEATWALWFGLPTIHSQLRGIMLGTLMGDADV